MGIKELVNINENKKIPRDKLLNFSIKYSTLVYLKEELSFLKSSNKQYVSKIDDIYHFFCLQTSKILLKLADKSEKIDESNMPMTILKQVSSGFKNLIQSFFIDNKFYRKRKSLKKILEFFCFVK